jgi:hypothetical protein
MVGVVKPRGLCRTPKFTLNGDEQRGRSNRRRPADKQRYSIASLTCLLRQPRIPNSHLIQHLTISDGYGRRMRDLTPMRLFPLRCRRAPGRPHHGRSHYGNRAIAPRLGVNGSIRRNPVWLTVGRAMSGQRPPIAFVPFARFRATEPEGSLPCRPPRDPARRRCSRTFPLAR